ncbi:unnamed protein product [Trichobilharzia regenti]|nr:unnamed protein product [Trichobilharzia regenti]
MFMKPAHPPVIDSRSKDILIEVRTFCVEFTKAREATTLHRLILNMENAANTQQQDTSNSNTETTIS